MTFEERIEELLRFKEENGHTHVQQHSGGGLGGWDGGRTSNLNRNTCLELEHIAGRLTTYTSSGFGLIGGSGGDIGGGDNGCCSARIMPVREHLSGTTSTPWLGLAGK